jgi:glycosyltransferase involved in cell wall biosynthesis
MRVLLVSPADLSRGRGAENVLGGALAGLARRVEVKVVTLGECDAEFARIAAAVGVSRHPVEYRTYGWFVRNADEIARAVAATAVSWRADLVVLYWEIWDLLRALSAPLRAVGVRFAVVLHAIPFAYAPARVSGFYRDAVARLVRDRDPVCLGYGVRRLHGIERALRRVRVIAANPTVSYYLRHYFPGLPFAEVSLGAAVALPAPPATPPGRAERTHDCVFMAALEPGKGIFALPAILGRVVAQRPEARLLVLGAFERPADERRFHAQLRRAGLVDRVDLAGWLRGADKYTRLARCGVFVYPSYAADTFAVALLEALACGVPAVTYDVPFARASYPTAAVRRVPLGDTTALADAVVGMLADPARHDRLAEAARSHAASHASWDAVAEAQLRTFAWASR